MNLDSLFYLVLITFFPWIELRGAIPVGFALGLNPWLVFFVCVAANILLIFPVFLFLDLVFPFIEKIPVIQGLLERVRLKTENYVEKYGFFGLTVFVAIPLPGTGAYSGALGAYLLGIKKRNAVPAIALGVIIAGVLVSLISLGFFELILKQFIQ